MGKFSDWALRLEHGMDAAADRVWDVLECAWRPLRTPLRILYRCLDFTMYAMVAAVILLLLFGWTGNFLRHGLCGEVVVFGHPVDFACGGVCGQWDILIFSFSIACAG